MAKKKEEVQHSFTDQIIDEITKDYGDGVIVDGNSVIAEPLQIIPWSPTLDAITSGGIEEGSWVGITGQPKTGKTTSVLSFAANCQKPEYGSRPVYYSKVEGRLSTTHLKGIKGLDLGRGKFNIIQSTETKLLSAQDHLKILINIVKTVPNAVVIIDSISALVDERELNDGIGTETRGGGAKLYAQFCRLLNNVVPVHKTIVLGITHLIANTSGYGSPYREKAAQMWLYQKDYDLIVKKHTPWKVGEKQIGLEVNWLCKTSKLGPPGMASDSFIRFGVGIDKLYELVNFGIATGLIKKGGAWFNFEFGSNTTKFQGLEKLYQALVNDQELTKTLENEVGKLIGTVACQTSEAE